VRVSGSQLRALVCQIAPTLAFMAVSQAAVAIADGPRLYAACVGCHGPNAWGSPDGAIPNLAGQQKRYLEKQLALFRSGVRVDDAMQAVTAHQTFSNQEDIVALANYLSALDADPSPVKGLGQHLPAGEDSYTHICAACHGVDGRGEAANRVPRIAGQHYPYLGRQIAAAAALHKDTAPPEMTSALRGMRPQDRDALADFISRLGNSSSQLDTSRREEVRK
jgi:cytochrome c553